MARMIPAIAAPEAPASERYVYDRFQSVLAPAWTVIHSQRFLLPANRGNREGELDFLVLDPFPARLAAVPRRGIATQT